MRRKAVELPIAIIGLLLIGLFVVVILVLISQRVIKIGESTLPEPKETYIIKGQNVRECRLQCSMCPETPLSACNCSLTIDTQKIDYICDKVMACPWECPTSKPNCNLETGTCT